MFIITSLFPTKNNYRRIAERPTVCACRHRYFITFALLSRETHAFHRATRPGKYVNKHWYSWFI